MPGEIVSSSGPVECGKSFRTDGGKERFFLLEFGNRRSALSARERGGILPERTAAVYGMREGVRMADGAFGEVFWEAMPCDPVSGSFSSVQEAEAVLSASGWSFSDRSGLGLSGKEWLGRDPVSAYELGKGMP